MASDAAPPPPVGSIISNPDFRLCSQFPGTPPVSLTSLDCEANAIGRYVYLIRPAVGILALCEVEVYGIGTYDRQIKCE